MEFRNFIPTIKQKNISVYASGNSILSYTNDDFNLINKNSFSIGINYCVPKLPVNLIFYSDKIVTDYLAVYFAQEKKSEIIVTRQAAFNPNISNHTDFKQKIDYWFDKNGDKLDGNYTIVWLLKMLTEYLPEDKKIFIHGLDMKIDPKDSENVKWYDKFTKHDKLHRGRSFLAQQKLDECKVQLDQFILKKEMIINCNPDSGYNGFKKDAEWKTTIAA